MEQDSSRERKIEKYRTHLRVTSLWNQESHIPRCGWKAIRWAESTVGDEAETGHTVPVGLATSGESSAGSA